MTDSLYSEQEYLDPADIPGPDLHLQGIRIKYSRDPHSTAIQKTLAWRRAGDRIHFGITKYNPKDRWIEKVMPSKRRGRQEAIRKLFLAEISLCYEQVGFLIDSDGSTGCCSAENFGFMLDWFDRYKQDKK